jgi:branched-chain amino acid transport system substrate-binding protein
MTLRELSMQRNLLSAKHLFLLGLVVALSGCTDMSKSPWLSTARPAPPLSETPSVSALPQEKIIPTQTKISLLLPLSGKGAETGQAMLNAAQLAMFDMNATSIFELKPEDTGRGTAEAMANAIAQKSQLIIGPVFSADTKMVTPSAVENNVNVVSFSTDTSAAVGNTFLMGFMPQAQVNTIMAYAYNVGLKRIALIAPRDVYGDSVTATYSIFKQRYATDSGGLIRYASNGLPTAEDMSQLKSGFDAVLIAAPALESHKISLLLSEAGYPPSAVKRLGTGLWDQAEATKLSGLQSSWYAASSPRLRLRFENRYFDTYGTHPPRLASLAYDATALAVVLTKSGQGFSRDTLTNPNGFAGIDGIFRFSPDGIAERGLAILAITDGRSVVLQDAPQRFGGR